MREKVEKRQKKLQNRYNYSLKTIGTSLLFIGSIILISGSGMLLNDQGKSCSTRETVEVNGDSMEPLLENGEKATLLKGYYDCHNASKDDIVVYDWSGQDQPLVKIVKADQDDKITFDGCNVLVNGEKITNTEGRPYCLDRSRRDRLKKDINYNVPDVMLLGNEISGSLDSSLFGLVHEENLVGKVKLN